MMLIKRNDLPVRPPVNSAESLAGYLYRLQSYNGHSVPPELMNPLRVINRSYSGKKDYWMAVTQLKDFLGDNGEADLKFFRQRTSPDRCRQLWGWGEFRGLVAFRFCSRCLGDIGVHLASWELASSASCKAHQQALIDRCPSCTRLLKWTTLMPGWQCPCEYSLVSRNISRAKTTGPERRSRIVRTVPTRVRKSGAVKV
jgi:hypothetical protein